MGKYTGNDLIKWGFTPNPVFKHVLETINKESLNYDTEDKAKTYASSVFDKIKEGKDKLIKTFYSSSQIPVHDDLKDCVDFSNPYEKANYEAVMEQVEYIKTLPLIHEIFIMGDACPTGEMPVGTAVVTKGAIYPTMHSADMCCSINSTHKEFSEDINYIFLNKKLQRELVDITKFGFERFDEEYIVNYLKSINSQESLELLNSVNSLKEQFKTNRFLKSFKDIHKDLATSGNGNHFVSLVKSSVYKNKYNIISHFGSRNLGAKLYSQAKKLSLKLAKEKLGESYKGWGFFVTTDPEYYEYMVALEILYLWTKLSHKILHFMLWFHISKFDGVKIHKSNITGYNNFMSHNHIFVNSLNSLKIHVKGANFIGLNNAKYINCYIPINFNDPIIQVSVNTSSFNFTSTTLNKDMFLPHGAGRNMSRSQFLKTYTQEEIEKSVNKNIYFKSETPDYSEYPLAYKSIESILKSLQSNKSIEITDTLIPIFSVMSGK